MVTQFTAKTEKGIRTSEHAKIRAEAQLSIVLHYRARLDNVWHELGSINRLKAEELAKALIENGLAQLVTGWQVKEDGRLERSPIFKYAAREQSIAA
jgi:hypothetical protein